MKKILTLFTLILVLCIAGPKIIGSNVNQNIVDSVSSINEVPGYIATIKSLETGWFSTSVAVNIGFDPAIIFDDESMDLSDELTLKNLNIDINIYAQHGPFLSLDGLGLGLLSFNVEFDDDIMREFINYSNDQQLYKLEGRMSLLGTLSYIDSIPPFTLKDIADSSRFDGWSGEGKSSSSQTTYQGEMPLFMMIDGDESLEITSVTIGIDADIPLTEAMTRFFYNSQTSFNIGSVRYESLSIDEKFSMKNVGLTALNQISKDGEFLNSAMNYSIESISVSDFNAEDLVMNVEVNNLDKELINGYEELYTNISSMEELIPEMTQEEIMNLLDKYLLPQLKVSPELNFTEISGNIADSSFSGYIKSRLTGIDSLPEDLEDINFWLSKVVIESKFTVDKSMASWIGIQILLSQMEDDLRSQFSNEGMKDILGVQVEGMIEAFTQQGMLAKNLDGDLEMTFILKDKQAFLNNEPIELPF